MAVSFSTKLRNDAVSSVIDDFAASDILEIKTGAPPAANSAPTGTVLATVTLPASPWGTVASGSVSKNNTWSDTSADATGTAGHFVIRQASDNGSVNDGTKPRITGTVTATGGGGDLTVDNTSFATGQSFTITAFSIGA
jgi:hypothetical protein